MIGLKPSFRKRFILCGSCGLLLVLLLAITAASVATAQTYLPSATFQSAAGPGVAPDGFVVQTPTATTTRLVFLPVIMRSLPATSTPSPTPTAIGSATPTVTPTWTPSRTSTPTLSSGPQDGSWTGKTSRNYPMSFDVSANGTKWASFKLKTRFSVGGCSGTLETTVNGPGTISGGKFSYSSSTYAFSGQFNTSTSASGTYAWSNYNIYGCGYFTQSGTWTATAPASTQRAAIASGSEACLVEQVDQLENGQMRVCIAQRIE